MVLPLYVKKILSSAKGGTVHTHTAALSFTLTPCAHTGWRRLYRCTATRVLPCKYWKPLPDSRTGQLRLQHQWCNDCLLNCWQIMHIDTVTAATAMSVSHRLWTQKPHCAGVEWILEQHYQPERCCAMCQMLASGCSSTVIMHYYMWLRLAWQEVQWWVVHISIVSHAARRWDDEGMPFNITSAILLLLAVYLSTHSHSITRGTQLLNVSSQKH